ncbi:hypothetical protein G9A89_018190 [Geosiphon pyriformis]|nr:hypothetical protein G9A89_018190 [Geosiphon pyriformis]
MSAGGSGTGSTDLGTHLSAKKHCVDNIYSYSAFHKKLKKPVANDTVNSSAGLLSMGDFVSTGVKPVVS